jgi:hypothetical protein
MERRVIMEEYRVTLMCVYVCMPSLTCKVLASSVFSSFDDNKDGAVR